MTPWVAPPVARIDEPFTGSERATLEGFLQWQRASLLAKCTGLDADQLARRAVPPSSLSLLGLLRHLAVVERTWFRCRVAGQDLPELFASEPAVFDVSPEHAERDYRRLVEEQEQARVAVADRSLEATFDSPRWGPMSVRWVYVHLLDEYARHCGHADLLRERIDGVTGV